MYAGLHLLFRWTSYYEALVTLKKDCKWYEVFKKRAIQKQIDYIYPLMLAEKRLFNDLKTNQ